MAGAHDPFATHRGNQTPVAIDLLSVESLEELKANIQELYRTTSSEASTLSAMPQPLALSEVHDDFVQKLEAALATTPHFQKIVLEEYVTPYMHNVHALVMESEWALGVYLPGFYDIFDSFDSGENFLKKLMPLASARARSVVEDTIAKHVSRTLERLEYATLHILNRYNKR